MAENTDGKTPRHHTPDRRRAIEVPLWQSTLDEARAAAPPQLRPAFINKVNPSGSIYAETVPSRQEPVVRTSVGEISAPRIDFHTRTPEYFMVSLVLKTPWTAESSRGAFMRALTVTTPNTDNAEGLVTLTKFTKDGSPGEVFKPEDDNFGREKAQLLADVAAAAESIRK